MRKIILSLILIPICNLAAELQIQDVKEFIDKNHKSTLDKIIELEKGDEMRWEYIFLLGMDSAYAEMQDFLEHHKQNN